MQRLVLLYLIVATPSIEARRAKVSSIVSLNEGAHEGANEGAKLETTGTEGKCPRFEPTLDKDSGGVMPSLVLVTIKSVKNLAKGNWVVSNIDPYVEFWFGEQGQRNWWIKKALDTGHIDEKYWRARTQTKWNNTDPSWEWTCMMAYSAPGAEVPPSASTISFQIYDSNRITSNTLLAKASGNLLEILEAEDTRGDGEIDVQFGLNKPDGEALVLNKGKKDEKKAILHVKFEVLREKSRYGIRGEFHRDGTGGSNTKKVWYPPPPPEAEPADVKDEP